MPAAKKTATRVGLQSTKKKLKKKYKKQGWSDAKIKSWERGWDQMDRILEKSK